MSASKDHNKYGNGWSTKLSFVTKPKHLTAIRKAMSRRAQNEMLQTGNYNLEKGQLEPKRVQRAETPPKGEE